MSGYEKERGFSPWTEDRNRLGGSRLNNHALPSRCYKARWTPAPPSHQNKHRPTFLVTHYTGWPCQQPSGMAYPHTPRRLGARPALHPTASSPNLSLNASKSMARQASLSALVGGNASPTSTRMGADGRDIDVGDTVDVPGGMMGVVKFVGSIRGKQGVFAGVELSREYAARGKNDGAVDG